VANETIQTTFRITPKLLNRFRHALIDRGKKMTPVIESLILGWLQENEGKNLSPVGVESQALPAVKPDLLYEGQLEKNMPTVEMENGGGPTESGAPSQHRPSQATDNKPEQTGLSQSAGGDPVALSASTSVVSLTVTPSSNPL